ncbi:sugar ABC transporter permease [Paenibacillus agaridevorans]|uniref:Sugar ABC transporter permease n=1 Tax=Paenibacillus agaridevorans TaxID=171404 RepID=A0A2R5EKX0_9BACL|nr:sugar ABC transporter permease [Paenibacillus agaridevorans]GBG05618.1 sugar ABC transporter permease [Paenibacillus agaridevorans]
MEKVSLAVPLKYRKKKRFPILAALFLVPSVLSFVVFKYVPMLYAIVMSLFDFSIMNPPGPFVGLSNFIHLFKSSLFQTALYNTFVIALLSLVMTFWIPILQAMLLIDIRRGNTLFRFLYLLPAAVPSIAAVLIWKWLYNPDYGLLNAILERIGLPAVGWLNDPAIAKFSLVLPGVLGGGLAVLIYYSALQGVSREIVESSTIDGAGPWRRMISIYLPGLKFIIGIQFIQFLATAFLAFDNIYVMTGGGPANSTNVMSLMVYNSAFKQNQFGMAGAISFIIFAIVAIITLIQIKVSNKE